MGHPVSNLGADRVGIRDDPRRVPYRAPVVPWRHGDRDDDIERLRSTVSVVYVVGQFVALRKTGRNWSGWPVPRRADALFNVREETGRYKCFGCDKSGDVFTFVQEHEHVDFVGAVEYLAAKVGMQLTYTTTGQTRERARRKQLVEAMGRAIEWYHGTLLDDPSAWAARDYLRSLG